MSSFMLTVYTPVLDFLVLLFYLKNNQSQEVEQGMQDTYILCIPWLLEG